MKIEIKSLEKDWHPWFAWYPVTIRDDSGREYRVWFIKVLRKTWIGNGYVFHSYKFI